MGFNKEQRQAIRHKEGPLLVVAGPGSGKTTVIVNRTKELIQKGVDPDSILVITFTRDAAKEMESRFFALMDGEKPNVTFGTIHSLALRILVHSFRYSYEDVLGEQEKARLLKKLIRDLHIDTEDISQLVRGVSNAIGFIKSRQPKDFDEAMKIFDTLDCGCNANHFARIYKEYLAFCEENKRIDYDDIQILCLKKLKEDKRALKLWRDQYQYISVDECQDMDYVQAELVYLLARPKLNICIVGDDDQSLYKFRGAEPGIMLDFEKKFDAKKIVLDTNYRSGEQIVNLTSDFIKRNKVRFDKDFKSVRKRGKLSLCTCANVSDQTRHVTREIKMAIKAGVPVDEIAVIYRTNAESGKIIAGLIEEDIPFVAKRRDTINLFEHWIFKDIVNFYELARDPMHMDFERVKRALKRPTRYIPVKATKQSHSLQELIDWGFENRKPYIARNLHEFRFDIRSLHGLPLNDFMNHLINNMEYKQAILDYAEYNRYNPQELIAVLDEIVDSAADFKDFDDWIEYTKDYTFTLEESSEEDRSGVHLLTMHSSKGLEFKRVFIINAYEGNTPYAYKGTISDLEEERRMFYVAMTRAKDQVMIFYPLTNSKGKELDPSRYIDDLQEALKNQKTTKKASA